MIPQNMYTGTLHGGEGVGHITRPFEVRILIEIVDPVAQLDDEIGPNGVGSIDERLHQSQRCGAQLRPLVVPVVNIGDERNL